MVVLSILFVPLAYFVVLGAVIRTIFWHLESAPSVDPPGSVSGWGRLADLIALVSCTGLPILFAYNRIGNEVVGYLPAYSVLIVLLLCGWLYAIGYITRKGILNPYLRLFFLAMVAPITIAISVVGLPLVFTSGSFLGTIARIAILCVLIANLRWACARCLEPNRGLNSNQHKSGAAMEDYKGRRAYRSHLFALAIGVCIGVAVWYWIPGPKPVSIKGILELDTATHQDLYLNNAIDVHRIADGPEWQNLS